MRINWPNFGLHQHITPNDGEEEISLRAGLEFSDILQWIEEFEDDIFDEPLEQLNFDIDSILTNTGDGEIDSSLPPTPTQAGSDVFSAINAPPNSPVNFVEGQILITTSEDNSNMSEDLLQELIDACEAYERENPLSSEDKILVTTSDDNFNMSEDLLQELINAYEAYEIGNFS